MNTLKHIYYPIIVLLLLLWIPVALDKIVNFNSFSTGILNQPFNKNLAFIAIYSLPVLEFATVALLVFKKYRKWGFALSSVLMFVFTSYVALALLGTWEKLPCGCGSVISGLSWIQHFWFNILFLSISVIGYIVNSKIIGYKYLLSTKINLSLKTYQK
ncbi:MauE/DoxX family redox-associated membrane protein [Sphingobacterium composti Ten et al. 2007 non Yoo et al. 2007]|uniref:MauE/DoxX family redox-associated membrane protein n=1 Tax=Sphingobacterium composti TaxID=363260 RepID=UPI001916C944|nr:MauE/DoxX family redox-associated membrane protein [Sphingobacterium composti Ten et al. 2007 non Yoo et al. 2007]